MDEHNSIPEKGSHSGKKKWIILIVFIVLVVCLVCGIIAALIAINNNSLSAADDEKLQLMPTEETENKSEENTDTLLNDKPAAGADYSSYLGTWSYTDVPDNAGDIEIPEDQYIITTLNITGINGNKVEFELTKGNILTAANASVSGEIVDGVIDFEYIDGWGSKGHGTITLNEVSVHVFCVQEESNTYNSPGYRGASLGCDETLTR